MYERVRKSAAKCTLVLVETVAIRHSRHSGRITRRNDSRSLYTANFIHDATNFDARTGMRIYSFRHSLLYIYIRALIGETSLITIAEINCRHSPVAFTAPEYPKISSFLRYIGETDAPPLLLLGLCPSFPVASSNMANYDRASRLSRFAAPVLSLSASFPNTFGPRDA